MSLLSSRLPAAPNEMGSMINVEYAQIFADFSAIWRANMIKNRRYLEQSGLWADLTTAPSLAVQYLLGRINSGNSEIGPNFSRPPEFIVSEVSSIIHQCLLTAFINGGVTDVREFYLSCVGMLKETMRIFGSEIPTWVNDHRLVVEFMMLMGLSIPAVEEEEALHEQ